MVLEREIEQHVQVGSETARLPRLVNEHHFSPMQIYMTHAIHVNSSLSEIPTRLTPVKGHQKNGVQVP